MWSLIGLCKFTIITGWNTFSMIWLETNAYVKSKILLAYYLLHNNGLINHDYNWKINSG